MIIQRGIIRGGRELKQHMHARRGQIGIDHGHLASAQGQGRGQIGRKIRLSRAATEGMNADNLGHRNMPKPLPATG